jgi:hypothetical protein
MRIIRIMEPPPKGQCKVLNWKLSRAVVKVSMLWYQCTPRESTRVRCNLKLTSPTMMPKNNGAGIQLNKRE